MKKVTKAVAAIMLFGTVLYISGCKEPEPIVTPFTVSGSNGGHDYVDLGLPSGTLWALVILVRVPLKAMVTILLGETPLQKPPTIGLLISIVWAMDILLPNTAPIPCMATTVLLTT